MAVGNVNGGRVVIRGGSQRGARPNWAVSLRSRPPLPPPAYSRGRFAADAAGATTIDCRHHLHRRRRGRGLPSHHRKRRHGSGGGAVPARSAFRSALYSQCVAPALCIGGRRSLTFVLGFPERTGATFQRDPGHHVSADIRNIKNSHCQLSPGQLVLRWGPHSRWQDAVLGTC